MLCIKLRATNGVAGLPPMVIPSRAARALPETLRREATPGQWLPNAQTAPTIRWRPEFRIPLRESPEARAAETARYHSDQSRRRLPQCADAVRRNIPARLILSAACQPKGTTSRRNNTTSRTSGTIRNHRRARRARVPRLAAGMGRSCTIIQFMPNRSRTCPKREAKNVSCIGINT